jgi:hypothetical protein
MALSHSYQISISYPSGSAPGTELASPQQRATRAFCPLHSRIDIARDHEPEPEVHDPATHARTLRALIERDDVMASWRPRMNPA